MFGNNGGQMKHMVDKHEWDKLNKKAGDLDVASKVELATACGESKDEQAPFLLIVLMKDHDESVQVAAVNSLGLVGGQNAKTNLQWLSGHLPNASDKLKQAIHDAVLKIGNRR